MVPEEDKAPNRRRSVAAASDRRRCELLAAAAAVPLLGGTGSASNSILSRPSTTTNLAMTYGSGGSAILSCVGSEEEDLLGDATPLAANSGKIGSLEAGATGWCTLDLDADHRLTPSDRQWFRYGLIGVILYNADGEPLTLVYDHGQERTTLVHTVSDAGQYSVEVVDIDDGRGAAYLRTETQPASEAVSIQYLTRYEPWPLPGRIQAEDFDHGGQGSAYNDMTAGNRGTVSQPNEDIDIVHTDAGYAVIDTDDGEWLEYTVGVESVLYDMKARVAGGTDESQLTVSRDGRNLGTIEARIDHLGEWRMKPIKDVSVSTDGPATLRLTIAGGNFVADWIDSVQRADERSTVPAKSDEYSVQTSGEYGYSSLSA
ncbi:carbohydrate-binding domain-containing protein [Natrialbaceae archaeon GCM10025810]|uniref:carbohydrate-binding domain-containing protein n=1 Tax=Halovalidus salilacus TaxID=3075124 RepID=UPI00361603E1